MKRRRQNPSMKPALYLALLVALFAPTGIFAIGQPRYVSDTAEAGGFVLAKKKQVAALYVDSRDWPGVLRAAGDLQSDIARVTGLKPAIVSEKNSNLANHVIIGTIGRSRIIDGLVKAKKLDVRRIEGKWESFLIQVIRRPAPGIGEVLVIAGSDRRGTIYGIYDLSEQIGVSPSHWWADVPVQRKNALFVKAGTYIQGPPSVKYRGIFINDESPDLSGWVAEKFGAIPAKPDPPIPPDVANYGSRFYAKVFEAILRMKGNYLWPAMWNNAFNEDDPDNARLADEYGIVMGTSHQEPMLRAQKEWDRRYQKTLGRWNYFKTPEILQDFWRQGIRRNKSFESILTLGLRGADDTPMIPGGTVAQSMALLEEIVSVQRKMIAEEIHPDITKVPQLWCLYKEVQEYYNAGLRVPEDVTLLWADDNWGNIRRLPTDAERKRPGGAGIYYHFDYVGGPRNYKWINTVSIPAVWEQMSVAKDYGADRIWIVNVGHLKHVLLPMEFFLQLGYDTGRWNGRNLGDYTRLWAAREFGARHASEIAEIVDAYTRFNSRRKPELLEPGTYSQTNYREAEKIVADFRGIEMKAERIFANLPQEARDAFYELVLFPVKACAQVNALYAAAGKNALYAQQGRAATNDLANQVQRLFDADAALMRHYNQTFAGGKWNHFMDQVHIGYTIWQDPKQNIMPKVARIDLPTQAIMSVAVEGSDLIWPSETAEPALPPFDALNRQGHYFEIFNRGQASFSYKAKPDRAWIRVSAPEGSIDKETRIGVTIDWSQAPKGEGKGSIQITGPVGSSVSIRIAVRNPASVTRATLDGFVAGEGYVSMEAEHYSKNVPGAQARWEKISGYGRTLSAMSIRPTTARSVVPPKEAPCLEYKMYLFGEQKADVWTTVAPTLNFDPGRGLRYAVSFDQEPPQIISVLQQGYDARNGNREWEESVRNAGRRVRSTHTLSGAGYHTLKIWMVDPGVVLQKIVVDLGGMKPSYLGPPESYRVVSTHR
jgi:hypothetical protein